MAQNSPPLKQLLCATRQTCTEYQRRPTQKLIMSTAFLPQKTGYVANAKAATTMMP